MSTKSTRKEMVKMMRRLDTVVCDLQTLEEEIGAVPFLTKSWEAIEAEIEELREWSYEG